MKEGRDGEKERWKQKEERKGWGWGKREKETERGRKTWRKLGCPQRMSPLSLLSKVLSNWLDPVLGPRRPPDIWLGSPKSSNTDHWGMTQGRRRAWMGSWPSLQSTHPSVWVCVCHVWCPALQHQLHETGTISCSRNTKAPTEKAVSNICTIVATTQKGSRN